MLLSIADIPEVSVVLLMLCGVGCLIYCKQKVDKHKGIHHTQVRTPS